MNLHLIFLDGMFDYYDMARSNELPTKLKSILRRKIILLKNISRISSIMKGSSSLADHYGLKTKQLKSQYKNHLLMWG